MSNKMPIFRVTSKVATEMLIKETKRKNKYINGLLKKVQKEFPEVVNVVYRDDAWDNKIVPYAVVFKDNKAPDPKMWKKFKDAIFCNEQKAWLNPMTPKRNTKKGKELWDRLMELLPNEKFYQSEELLNKIGYNPKKQVDEVSANRIRVTTFRPGYKKDGKNWTFIFGGYEGYKPPRGVKEMLMSEYNKMIKE